MLLLQFYYKNFLISGMILKGQPFSKYLLSIFYSLEDNYFGSKKWNSMPNSDMCEGSGTKPTRALVLFGRAKPGSSRQTKRDERKSERGKWRQIRKYFPRHVKKFGYQIRNNERHNEISRGTLLRITL